MPSYNYVCPKCELYFEDYSFIMDADKDENTCPKCGEKAERIIAGRPTFYLRGDGFYATRKGRDAVIT